eukprot:CAMPEP_0175679322 /NCGR_PEP_ID=MMETSP0097-20121207/24225_1 /TAXON_ID=311494 /ORGANISM="Alexandrium monilatum, Strain CCMP3105" /LENGTH=227 /DNA_ID=CAMNT_0016986143 /DNA_START=191 /DNA_END=870 /DNA_ORIENTATION=-
MPASRPKEGRACACLGESGKGSIGLYTAAADFSLAGLRGSADGRPPLSRPQPMAREALQRSAGPPSAAAAGPGQATPAKPSARSCRVGTAPVLLLLQGCAGGGGGEQIAGLGALHLPPGMCSASAAAAGCAAPAAAPLIFGDLAGSLFLSSFRAGRPSPACFGISGMLGTFPPLPMGSLLHGDLDGDIDRRLGEAVEAEPSRVSVEAALATLAFVPFSAGRASSVGR